MKTKLLSLCLALICATQLFAYDCLINGIYYNIDNATKTATVTNRTGDYDAKSYSGAVNIPASISYNSQTYSVTTIGNYAFFDCSGLTSVTIPNSVTTIGSQAFDACNRLIKTNYTGTIADWCKIKFDYSSSNPIYCSHNFYINDVEVKDLVIPNGVDTIGKYAFYGCSGLTSVTIPNSVTTIEDFAFYNCSGLSDIYSYAEIPPSCEPETVFYGVSQHCYIHVPAGTVRAYELAFGWSHFLHFFEISEVPVGGTDQVGVEVTNNTAVFSWPVNPIASSYTLVIKKNDEVFCTLTFNSLGQLVGMAFAPARGANNDSSAQSTAYGYSFMVSNLDASSTYNYTFTAKDASNNVLTTTTGQFKTGGTATDLLPLLYEDNSLPFREGLGVGFVKFIHNGHLLIERNGIRYNAHGARVK